MCYVTIYGFLLNGNSVKKIIMLYFCHLCFFSNHVTEISSTSLEHFVIMSLCAICLDISFNINVYNSVYSQVMLYGVQHMTCGKK